MFHLTIQAVFSAAHAIVIKGEREPLHGHNWRVRAVVEGPNLDSDGLLVDFHALERHLAEIIRPFHNRNLNDVAPFDRVNPTAEHVARHIATELARHLTSDRDATARAVRVLRVSVTEAEGCDATYAP
ncbi:MAG: 6-pyruvoyl trahydropterin synthase family protein [Phycisphaerales bacterium]